ncbi:hypothetical protein CEXT_281841 [Caerostris extrusa]|uniref:Uncharacterized protein n=1 Tax=Caerostris extrusa TaxID=172846 RepID=A0AAV4SFX3_CAEEX|nr:hypothetical protein CEXT_281841 [Caerostris extrusa]
MSELCSNAVNDGDFDTIMENSIQQLFTNFSGSNVNSWIKDEGAGAYLEINLCWEEMCWEEMYFVEFNISICDSNYKVLFEDSTPLAVNKLHVNRFWGISKIKISYKTY